MYYNNCLISAYCGVYNATLDGQLVATAPSKQELFAILDGLVERYHRNK